VLAHVVFCEEKMDNRGLLFIPDISGYTRFINQTEIEHSRFIIQDLLETLVNSNQLSLSISEIEGDAILFYRFGEPPSLTEMYKQVEAMFCNFHKQLKRYEQRRICPCVACKSAQDLSLKIITHHGEFSTYTVKEFSKLIGKDVITAHQLLKNDIPLHEYWLLTDCLYNPTADETTIKQHLPNWMEWQSAKKEEEREEIPYYYSLLTPLRENLPEEDLSQFAIQGERLKIINVSKQFDIGIQSLFGLVADFEQRANWLDGIKGVDGVSTRLPQVGTSHNCIMNNGKRQLITSYFSQDEKSITMEETDKRRITTCQIYLERHTASTTVMTFNFFVKRNIVLPGFFRLFLKKHIEKALIGSLLNLEQLIAGKQKTLVGAE
jgi:hypothetical protein